MEIFSNWVFWIILATIVFVLALIGYLTESMKKSKKEDNKEEQPKVENNVDTVMPENTVTEVKAQTDDWTTMPEVNKPLEEVKVDTISEPVENNEPTSAVDDLFGTPSVAPVAPSVNTEVNDTVSTDTTSADVTPSVEPTVSVETPEVQPVESNTTVTPEVPTASSTNVVSDVQPVEPNAATTPEVQPTEQNTSDSENKNNDIWNL